MWHCGAYQAPVFSHGSLSPCYSFPSLAVVYLISSLAIAFIHFVQACHDPAARHAPLALLKERYHKGLTVSWPLTLALLLQIAVLLLTLQEDRETDFLIATDSILLVALATHLVCCNLVHSECAWLDVCACVPVVLLFGSLQSIRLQWMGNA
jgi:hypothetical protein